MSPLFRGQLVPSDDSGRQQRSIGVALHAGEREGRRLIQVCTGASMASYDEMSPTNRRNLFEGLASLSGLQEGPKNALPDGTRYEYDAVLKRTVEITPSGNAFLWPWSTATLNAI